MSQFKTSGKGFNQQIGLYPGRCANAPLPLLTFPQIHQILTKEKEAKRKFLTTITVVNIL